MIISTAMNWIVIIVVLVVFGMLGFGAYVRMATDDAGLWHVDPLTTGRSGPNSAYTAPPEAPVFSETPDEVFSRLSALILAEERSVLLAEGPMGNHATYALRSKLWRFPDYVSLRVVPHEDGASVAVFARARFGYSDIGVNQARLDRWFEALNDANPRP